MLLWALGQTYYSVVLYYASPAPFPSPADVALPRLLSRHLPRPGAAAAGAGRAPRAARLGRRADRGAGGRRRRRGADLPAGSGSARRQPVRGSRQPRLPLHGSGPAGAAQWRLRRFEVADRRDLAADRVRRCCCSASATSSTSRSAGSRPRHSTSPASAGRSPSSCSPLASWLPATEIGARAVARAGRPPDRRSDRDGGDRYRPARQRQLHRGRRDRRSPRGRLSRRGR